ncbi:MAG: N-formylglutamate deformylase [Roseivirga sp.]|nr:N-formylglutamate deformylase [Roseivirga sp.]
MNPYKVLEPSVPRVPILLSVPHCGTEFPKELQDAYVPDMMAAPDDTDWFVDQLYSFAVEMGITMITARYSRWVIDLNRNPESKPLYNDGRIITGLCTTTDFHGNDIYQKNIPDQPEIDRRTKLYYSPYYQKVQELLDELKTEFGQVLLWDAHSIRQHVPTIRKDRFPDMILGSVDETSASKSMIDLALEGLGSGNFELKHNTPFKGGQITRTFGRPHENQHALQLEMNKVLYMDDTETVFDLMRANRVRSLLKSTLNGLSSVLLNK